MIYPGLDFAQWEDKDARRLYAGTRDLDTEIKHGVVREITSDGLIYERCYKEGKLHGLSIVYHLSSAITF